MPGGRPPGTSQPKGKEMNLQKHEREALSAVRRICRGIVAELRPAGKHSKLIARLAEKQVQVTVSSSPLSKTWQGQLPAPLCQAQLPRS